MKRILLFAVIATFSMTCQMQAQQKGTAHKHTSAKHAEHGPHDGDLLEVGNEEYHIEVVVNEEEKTIALYVLDQNVEKPVAIEAEHILVNFKRQGKPQQIKIAAKPQETDAKGITSCFAGQSNELFDALHDAHSDTKLSLKIGKKAYNVKLTHDHDHAHAHSHAAKSTKTQTTNANRTNNSGTRRR